MQNLANTNVVLETSKEVFTDNILMQFVLLNCFILSHSNITLLLIENHKKVSKLPFAINLLFNNIKNFLLTLKFKNSPLSQR